MTDTEISPKYRNVCQAILDAGGTPLPVSQTLVKIIKLIITEEEMDFVLFFSEKRSQSLDQLKETSGLEEAYILEITSNLAAKGVIFNQPSSSGLMIFRLLPFMNVGVFEYMFMKKLEYTDEKKELGRLFTQLFNEHRVLIQNDRETVLKELPTLPPLDRTVPFNTNQSTGNKVIQINQSITPQETFLPTQDVADLIEKFDEIAVGYCFCRQHQDVLDNSCQQTDLRECCFTFGKSARFTSEQGFMRMIEKKEALEILKQAEKEGLVHKAYHPNFDTSKAETSICNCCKCCCVNSVRNQREPIINAASYLAKVDEATCIGCETCVDYCYNDAISMTDDQIASVDEKRCIGCGVCAHFCPEEAIRLIEDSRIVRIAPFETE